MSETWELSVTNLWMYWLETITELSLHVQSYLMDILTVQDFYSTIDSRYMLLCMVDSQKCWAKLILSYTVYFQIFLCRLLSSNNHGKSEYYSKIFLPDMEIWKCLWPHVLTGSALIEDTMATMDTMVENAHLDLPQPHIYIINTFLYNSGWHAVGLVQWGWSVIIHTDQNIIQIQNII